MTTYRKINVYECLGTSDNSGNSYLPYLNPAIFDRTVITGYMNAIFPLNVSVGQGVSRVLEAISSNPGGFVLTGTSQGAQIMSEVYKRIKGTAREKDLLGVFLVANPERQAGRDFPGASSTAPGHGVATSDLRLTGTPDLVWEFAKPGDPVACNGDDYVSARTTEIYRTLYSDFSGLVSDLIGDVLGFANLLIGMAQNHATAYFTWAPIAGDPRTSYQIIADQLNNVVGPQHANDYAIPAGLDLASKANKPTFYYAQGTANIFDVFGVGAVQMFPGIDFNTDPFPTLLDPSIWNYQRVTYPAALFPMVASVADGVADLIARIKKTPGKFALGGYSLGAIVASRVYDEIRHGSLQNRRNDLLAGVTFGSTVREQGHSWPGSRFDGAWDVPGSTSGAHGALLASQRLVGTENLWWDFVQDGDLYSAVGNSNKGLAWSAVIDLVSGLNNPLGDLGEIIGHLGLLPGLGDLIADLIGSMINGQPSFFSHGLAQHGLYPTTPPPGYPAGTKTSFQLALDYLNTVGAAYQATLVAPAPVVALPPKSVPAAPPATVAPASGPFAWLQKLISDGESAVQATLAPLISATGLNPLVTEVQTLINALPQTSTGAINSLTNILNGLTSGSMPLSTALTKLGDLFTGTLSGTVATIEGAGTQLSTWWNSQVSSWYQQVVTMAGQSQQWLQNILAQGTQVLEDVLGSVLTTGQHALESAVNSFANGIAAADAGLSALMKSVVDAVNQGSATLHDAVSSLQQIVNSNLFSGVAAQLNSWWNSTVGVWFKQVQDIFGLPTSSTPVKDPQQLTPVTDITDPKYVQIHQDVTSMVTAPPPAIPASGPVQDVFKAITSGDPLAASDAAWRVAQAQSTPSTDIVVTLYDRVYNVVGEVNDYKSLTYTFARNVMGTATMVLKHSDPLVEQVMLCHEQVVPITIQNGSMRWSGRVEYVDYQMKDGEYDVTVYCTDDYQWFDKILCWPNFLLPIQVQLPSRSLYIGPAITCIKTLIAEQAFRLQSGIWELPNNLFSGNLDWQSWFANVLESDGDPVKMLMTPIVVVPTNPLFDTSPWTSINGRMDKISTLVDQVVKDCGLVLTANLWLPGDPQPDGMIVPLYAPTIVVDVKDMSGITGPTGTFIDGIITDVVDLQHGVLGDVLTPFLNPANLYSPEGINIAPLLGVNFVQPWVLFHDHPRGGLREFHLIPHAPLAHTIIGGGKSPKWVNDLINATLEWMIDAIEIAVGFTGVPNTLLDGTFDDLILAFQMVENATRRLKLGPYGFPEHFQQTGASAYTLDEWFALSSAMWDTRGYHGVIVNFDNGYPYTVGRDLFIGGLASFATRGKLYTDYVERITITDDANNRVKAEVMIGDGKSHENPVTRIQRHLVKFEEAINIITMSTN